MEEQKNKQEEEKRDKDQHSSSSATSGKQEDRLAQKQDQPHKNHGVPDDEEEGSRHGGLKGGDNFRKNMGCGG